LASIAYDLVPYLFPEEYLDGDPYADLYRLGIGRMRRYSKLLALSDSTRHDLHTHLGLPPSATATIGAASRPGFFTPGDSVRDHETPFILYLGQREARKNLSGMLAAYAALPSELRQRYQLRLVVPSTRDQAALTVAQGRALCGLHGAGDPVYVGDVFVMGDVITDEHLRALYRGCAVFCFPSLYEGFGLPLLEAIQCGAACVAGDNSAQRDFRGAALLVDAGKPEEIAGAVTLVLTGLEGTHALRRVAAARGAAYTWERVAAAFVAAVTPVGAAPLPPLPTAPYVAAPFPEAAHPPDRRFAEEYMARVVRGQAIAAGARVALCGLARDVAANIPTLRTGVVALAALFAEARLYLYENDSADATADLLAAWRDEPGSLLVWLKSERLNAPRWPQTRDLARASALAKARNHYHAAVLQDASAGRFRPDYVIVLDADMAGWSPDGALSTIGAASWDAMGSNGIQSVGGRHAQYDAWAWRDLGHPAPHHYTEINARDYDRGHPPVPVLSCFGGMGVYRFDAFAAGRYAGGDCEHVLFHHTLAQRGYPRIFCNPGQITLYRP
jgi:hypothetical protein